MPPTTLKELALLLNLAPSTVSRALHGHPDISKATQKRVKALARQLQYHPSIMATGLRNRTFKLLAVIVPNLAEFLYITALQGILKYASEKNYRILLYESEENVQKEADICHSLEKSGIDGLLISPAKTTCDSSHIRKLTSEGFPVVFFGRILGNIPANRVIEDDYTGAYMAVNSLIEHGCRKIAHIAAPQQWLWAQKRQMGYIQALLDHHISIDRRLILEYSTPEEIENIITKLIPCHIDGIFTVDDPSAAQALNVLRELNYKIPEDISVCGYGNDPLSRFTFPALTTIEQNGRLMGQKATELLIDQIENKGNKETKTILLKSKLIVRDSVSR